MHYMLPNIIKCSTFSSISPCPLEEIATFIRGFITLWGKNRYYYVIMLGILYRINQISRGACNCKCMPRSPESNTPFLT